jgi:hypothetical protein
MDSQAEGFDDQHWLLPRQGEEADRGGQDEAHGLREVERTSVDGRWEQESSRMAA